MTLLSARDRHDFELRTSGKAEVGATIYGMGPTRLHLRVELEQEDDGRWIADVAEIPGVMTYGRTREEALATVKVLALQVITDRLERGEDPLTGHALDDTCPPDEYLAALTGLNFTSVHLAI